LAILPPGIWLRNKKTLPEVFKPPGGFLTEPDLQSYSGLSIESLMTT